MEFLRQKIDQARRSWDQLSTSGRMALALTVLLVVAVLVIVSHYAGTAELVPLPTKFEPDELAPAVAALRAQNVDAEVRGGQIYVAAEKRSLALGMLAYSDALPESGISFDEIIGSGGMWEPESDKQRRWQYFLKRELERSIGELPGVRQASLSINFGSQHTLRSTPDGASASIRVKTSASTPLSKRTARAAAAMVTRSVPGLTMENVSVVDLTTGQSFDLSADSALYSSDYVGTLRAYREFYEDALRRQFANIRNLSVSVHVVPDLDRRSIRDHDVDPNRTIGGSSYERTSDTTGGSAAGEVGVIPNAGPSPASAASAGTESSGEERVGQPLDYRRTETVTEVTPGPVKEIAAAIMIPRSYLLRVAEAASGNGAAPAEGAEGEAQPQVDQAAFDAAFNAEQDKIRKQAMRVLGVDDEALVSVDWQWDFTPPDAEAAMVGAAGGGVLDAVFQHAPSALLGILAVVALGMVYSTVRKFKPADVPSESVSTESVSDAGLTLDSILEGVELEADTIRASKMQEQITNMIKEDPESVANLMKRWVVKE